MPLPLLLHKTVSLPCRAGMPALLQVIRGLATGALTTSRASVVRMLRQQAAVALLLGTGLSAGGFVRVLLTTSDVTSSIAISLSLFLIVVSSVLAGTGLPFALARAGIDPANAGTSIQASGDQPPPLLWTEGVSSFHAWAVAAATGWGAAHLGGCACWTPCGGWSSLLLVLLAVGAVARHRDPTGLQHTVFTCGGRTARVQLKQPP